MNIYVYLHTYIYNHLTNSQLRIKQKLEKIFMIRCVIHVDYQNYAKRKQLVKDDVSYLTAMAQQIHFL